MRSHLCLRSPSGTLKLGDINDFVAGVAKLDPHCEFLKRLHWAVFGVMAENAKQLATNLMR